SLLAHCDFEHVHERLQHAAHLTMVDADLFRPAAVESGVPRRLLVLGNGLLAALHASDPEVLQALQLAALALPVADGVLDELERACLAEVGNRENGLEDRLQPG